jgi:hypothetical protein
MDESSGTGTAVQELIRRQYRLPEWFEANLALLSQLQAAHDSRWNWKSTENMRERLREVAENFELNAAIVDQYSFAE